MSLDIQLFANRGDLERERLVLKAKSNLDVGSYAVFLSQSGSERSPTAGKKTAYWFPDVRVKEGDLVVLYTKKGRQSTKQNPSGSTVHFFYWGLSNPVWKDSEKGAVLINVLDWKWKIPKSL